MDTQTKLNLYPICDALGVELEVVTNHHVIGRGDRVLQIGPWRCDTRVIVTSDVVSDKVCAVLVKLRSKVWGYMVSKPHDLRLHIFDASVVSLKTDEADLFCTGSVSATLAKLKPAIRAQLLFDEKATKKWLPAPDHETPDNLDPRPQAARAERPARGPAA